MQTEQEQSDMLQKVMEQFPSEENFNIDWFFAAMKAGCEKCS
jgi:hypothetical protein